MKQRKISGKRQMKYWLGIIDNMDWQHGQTQIQGRRHLAEDASDFVYNGSFVCIETRNFNKNIIKSDFFS